MRPTETTDLRYNEPLRHFKVENKLQLGDILEAVPINHAVDYYGHEDLITEIGKEEVLQFATDSGWINGDGGRKLVDNESAPSTPEIRTAKQIAVAEDGDGNATILVLSNDGKMFTNTWSPKGFASWRELPPLPQNGEEPLC